MVYAKKGNGVYRKAAGRRRRVYRKRSKTSFAKRVKAVVMKAAEQKQATISGSFVSHNSGIGIGDIAQLVPGIPKGDTDGERNGDEIQAQRLSIKGHFILNTSYATANDARIAVRVMMVQPKNIGDYGSILNPVFDWTQHLLKRGSVTEGFTGTIANLYTPINSELIKVYYDKIKYITIPHVITQSGTFDLKTATRFFAANIKVGRKLKFSLPIGTSNNNITFNPVLLIGYSHLDGTAADVVTTQVQSQVLSTLYYKDF